MAVSLLRQARERLQQTELELAEQISDLTSTRNGVVAAMGEIDTAISALNAGASTPAPLVSAPVAKAGGLRTEDQLARFFAGVRGQLWPKMVIDQVKGCEAILAACAGVMPIAWAAYALATAYHETGYTMQPIKELGGNTYLSKYDTGRLAEMLGNTPAADGDGQKYAGRGYVQLTGARNYRVLTERLRAAGVLKPTESLVDTPDLAMRPDVAAAVMVFGMIEGIFTAKSLRTYLPSRATVEQFTSARRIINGTDKAALIAGYAIKFQAALIAAGWE